MSLRKLGAIGLSGTLVMLPIVTLADAQSFALPLQLAQSPDLGCQKANAVTGVYEQPNLDSPSRGVLAQNQTVRLQFTSDGWARIDSPLIGWVEAQYLTPTTQCNWADGADPANFAAQRNAVLDTSTPSSTTASATAAGFPIPVIENTSAPSTVSSTSGPVPCRVIPTNGLIVRNEPAIAEGTYVATIPQGEHMFQFSGESTRTPTEQGVRTWVYILSPQQGWISPGFIGETSNITGDRCG